MSLNEFVVGAAQASARVLTLVALNSNSLSELFILGNNSLILFVQISIRGLDLLDVCDGCQKVSEGS